MRWQWHIIPLLTFLFTVGDVAQKECAAGFIPTATSLSKSMTGEDVVSIPSESNASSGEGLPFHPGTMYLVQLMEQWDAGGSMSGTPSSASPQHASPAALPATWNLGLCSPSQRLPEASTAKIKPPMLSSLFRPPRS